MEKDRGVCLGLIGLGLVGTALAERFLEAGYCVCGCDIDPGRCRESQSRGVSIADSPARIAESSARVVFSLPDSCVVREVMLGTDGILSSGLPTLIMDTTTGEPDAVVEIAGRAASVGSAYVDACIIGSSRQVAEGEVIVVAGGTAEDLERCRDLLETFARETFHMGSPGKGSEAKLIVNLVLGLNRLVLSEGLVLAEHLNLDMGKVLDLLRAGASYSRVMDVKGEKMLLRDFRPQARLAQHLKDVRLILQLGRKAGLSLHLSDLHRRLLQAGADAGVGDLDNSAIIEVLRRSLYRPKPAE
ncbi:MAG: NAD(P)-dependent oxidoreductase [bacterium]